MAKKRIAINGFGRIGRLTFRKLWDMEDVDVVAINDLTDNATLAHLLKFDSAHGKFDHDISATDQNIIINGDRVAASSERDPSKLPWADMNIDTVIEATGVFRNADGAKKHIEAGAKRVVISAPGKGDGIETIVLGVNSGGMTDDAPVYSNASCTTNCLAPVVMVLDQAFGIDKGSLTTTHAYTSDQRIQDAPHSDLRRARAAAQNIIPTTTGAAAAVGKVYPPIKDKLFAIAIRVPVITGSMIELNVILNKDASIDDINEAFKSAADGPLKGVLEYSTDPLVSTDIIGNEHSCIFDSLMTNTIGNLVKVVAWYDNEAGYSARLAELVARL